MTLRTRLYIGAALLGANLGFVMLALRDHDPLGILNGIAVVIMVNLMVDIFYQMYPDDK